MMIFHSYVSLPEGNQLLEVSLGKTSDNVDRWKIRGGKSQRRERVRERVERRSEKRNSQKKEDAGAQKSKKVAKHCVLTMFCGSGRSKSRLAKAAGAEPSRQMRDQKIARRCGAKQISKSKC